MEQDHSKFLEIYAARIRAARFPTLQLQRYECISEFSKDWNDFVYYESARSAEAIGFGLHPLAFINDVLYTGT